MGVTVPVAVPLALSSKSNLVVVLATQGRRCLPPSSSSSSTSTTSSSSSSSFVSPLLLSSSGRCNFIHQSCSCRIKKRSNSRVYCSQIKLEDSVDDEACELVNGVELTLGEGENVIQAYLFKAVKNNNGTGVLLLSDTFGFEDLATRDFAYRVACNGYNVLLPDLFRGNPWTKSQPDSKFEAWRAQQAHDRVAKDIYTSAKWMVEEFLAAGISKKLGIIGFCFGGGRLLETLAQDDGAYFSTGVCFYGTRMNQSLAPSVKVPILFISGDQDPLCLVDPLHEMVKSIGRGSQVLVFEDRGHGFAHRPESAEEDRDAEEAFVAMRNWLHRSLIATE